MIQDYDFLTAIFTLYNKFSEILAAGVMSAFGGVAAYVYGNVKGDKPFKFSGFLISIFLAFFIGNLIGSFIPKQFEYRDGILLIAGYSAFPILALLESKGKEIVISFLEKRLLGITQAPTADTVQPEVK